MSEHIPDSRYEQELEEQGLLYKPDIPVTPVKSCGRWIGLLTRSAFEALPDGTVVVSINGAKCVKGVDYVDLDTRGGQIVYGVPIEGEDAETLTRIYGDPRQR